MRASRNSHPDDESPLEPEWDDEPPAGRLSWWKKLNPFLRATVLICAGLLLVVVPLAVGARLLQNRRNAELDAAVRAHAAEMDEREARATGFDPFSAENTLAWMASRMLESERVPAGNAVAEKDAAERLQTDISEVATGRRIRWEVKLGQVDGRGQFCISSLTRNLGPHPEIPKRDRYYQLGIVPPPDPIQEMTSVPFGRIHQSLPSAGFLPDDPSGGWVKKAAAGDRVLLVGRITRVAAHRGFAIVAVDGRVDQP